MAGRIDGNQIGKGIKMALATIDESVESFSVCGLRCRIRRYGYTGSYNAEWLCGYIELPETHPWLTMGFTVPAHVHGGITYNEKNTVGFDCNHGSEGTAWNVTRVRCELYLLAGQALAAMPVA